jgi:CRISPR/Cas system-associated endoribonuclease Cas2
MDTDFEIYKNKKFSGLLKDVVVNSEQKRAQIDVLISELRQLIKSTNDALIIVPMIKDYLDVGVKNDEQLIKLAAIVQRLAAAQSNPENGGGFGITEEERKALMAEAEKTISEMNKPIEIKN